MGVPEQPDDIGAALDAEAAGAAESEAAGSPRLATLTASTEEIIAGGESKWVEFKQTGRVNLHTNQRDEVIEQQVVKAVAGFMNAEGGTLLIGVSDSGEVTGIETDLKTLGKKQNTDGFAVWLNNLLDNKLGPTAAARAKFRFDDFSTGTVCRVDVTPGSEPTFAKAGKIDASLYVRLNNTTRVLNTAEALQYVRTRWP